VPRKNRFVSFWEGLTEHERLNLRRAGTVRTWAAGAVLFHEGDLSDVVLVILQGSVKVITNSSTGHRRLLAIRWCGDVIGEVSGICGTPRSATVQTTDRAETLAIPRAAFMRILQQSANATVELIKVVGERRRHADLERTEFGGSSVAQRVSTALVELVAQHPTTIGGTVTLPVTQDELASLAATSRSGVARTLVPLRQQEVVATMPRQIVILDVEKLRAAAPWNVSRDTAASRKTR
jgi:CRP/FNR family transcriptional regulator, cyclic AMP receptor protein